MKKLSEFENEEALDLLADILEPTIEIMSDKEVIKLFSESKTKAKGVSLAIKNHKESIIKIMARLDGVDVKDYKCNVLSLPIKVLEILNDKELVDFFALQSQNMDATSFGSVTESTEEIEEI